MPYDETLIKQVRRLRQAGVRQRVIGERVGKTELEIRAICAQYRIGKPTEGRLDVPVGIRLMEALREEADRRDERFDAFIRTLLLKIVEAKLFSAVIDDGK